MDGSQVKPYQLKLLLRLRAIAYSVFSKLTLQEPTKSDVCALAALVEALKPLASASEHDSFESVLIRLESAIDAVQTGKLSEQDLARSYAHLFAVGAGSVALSESVYRSPERLVMQEPRDAVVQFYGRNGFKAGEALCEPEDHIGAEFAFMTLLAERTCDQIADPSALLASVQIQKEFLKDHTLTWVDELANAVARADQQSWYGPLFLAAATFVTVDHHWLDAISREIAADHTRADGQ